jgi:hypothetical protein
MAGKLLSVRSASNVLNMNPWLEQSKGWLDYYESEGTLDARK